ncbi:F-box/LRR protein [Thalictrum thalictroides]|uniref:F-box/LRR protein n=1 Tax=Thalictrum thalictroides TaxID=46969 RepID=A0A7J6VP54_THATH|nr:F-box/LRR protein [Thalictrum thalictroides]
MKILRSREIYSPTNKSHKSRESINKIQSPSSPTTLSQTLEPMPSSSLPLSNPNNDSDLVSRGTSSLRRRSSRLASKMKDDLEDKNEGNKLINSNFISVSSEDIDISSLNSDESMSKDEVLELESVSLVSNLRRSGRIFSKLIIDSEKHDHQSKMKEVKNVEKRKSESIDLKSKKVRVFDSVSERGTFDMNLKIVGEDSNSSDTDSGKEMSAQKGRNLKESSSLEEVIELDELQWTGAINGKKHKEGTVEVDSIDNSSNLGLTTSSGSSRRRSQRLVLKETQGGDLGSGNGGFGNMGDISHPNDRESGPSVAAQTRDQDGLDISEVECIDADEHNLLVGKRRYSTEEKGKSKLDLNLEPEEQPEIELDGDAAVSPLMHEAASGLIQLRKTLGSEHARQEVVRSRWRNREVRLRRERFRNIATDIAPQFAHFRAEGKEAVVTVPTSHSGDALQEIEDWPGPFSTAFKIMKDRNAKLNTERQQLWSSDDLTSVIKWMPSKVRLQNRRKPYVPSLQDLCLNVLLKNSEAIGSLKYVPSELKNKLTQLLCDSRRMDARFMDLLVGEIPEIVRVKDCSWMTEEQMVNIFGDCDTSKLSELQLDLCGRSITDYVLRSTIARSPNSLPALVALSLKGACRVTDAGLSLLLASTPSLRSINLGQCSLLSSSSVSTIADNLGFILRELYLDDCLSIDAMLILPALKKLKCLEILSVASMQTVCDDFVCQYVTECSMDMKELCLADCSELTDISVKAIAEKCSGLCSLDLSNLPKLTDFSVGYIANGCPSIQKLKLSRNEFSDEAIAAFLETSGESLKELSLNCIKKVGPNTAISLAKCCQRNLLALDLSWCRVLTDEALGFIVDSCSSLRILKLFGCSQISNVFLNGHSNPLVGIVGVKMTPVLDHLNVLDPQVGPLCYSSVSPSESDVYHA